MRSPFTVRRLQEIQRSISPDIMFLMETKNEDAKVASSAQELGFVNLFTIPPVGLSGGLALL